MPVGLIQAFEELHKYKVTDFRSRRDLPIMLSRLLKDICEDYLSASDEERQTIRSHTSFEISFLFLIFSGQMAERAVQRLSQLDLMQSLAALLIENAAFDVRDSIIALSKVFHSAEKLGLQGSDFLLGVTGIASPNMANQLRAFTARDEAMQNIAIFGFKEGTNADGLFAYVPK